MIRLVLPIGMLLLGVALLLLGSGALNTLLALRSEAEGYTAQLIGLIMSAYFLGFLIGTYTALPLINRIGHIRAFAFCAAMAACATLLYSLWVNPWWWLLLRVITGVSLVTLYTVIESWLSEQTPAAQRGKVFAVYMVVHLGALALAQQLILLGDVRGYALFAIAGCLTCAALMPITWTRLAQPAATDTTRLSPRQLYALAPVGVVATVLSGLAMSGFWGLGAVYAGRIGLGAAEVAAFMSIAIIGGAVLQWPIGHYSDRVDRRSVLLFTAVGASAAAVLMVMLSYAGWLVMVAAFIYGGFAFSVYPLAVAHVGDHLKPEEMIAGISGLLLLNGIGAALGPALAGALMTHVGVHALPLYFCAVQGLLAVSVVMFVRRRAVDTVDHTSHFLPMLRTTPTVLEMLPDTEGTTEASATNTN